MSEIWYTFEVYIKALFLKVPFFNFTITVVNIDLFEFELTVMYNMSGCHNILPVIDFDVLYMYIHV